MSAETSSRSDESDHEEEFYYTEIEDSEDEETVTTSQANTSTSYLPQPSFSLPNGQMLVAPTALDHDYQRKVRILKIAMLFQQLSIFVRSTLFWHLILFSYFLNNFLKASNNSKL